MKPFLKLLLQPQGVRVAPGVKQQRLQAIRDKIAARAELLSRPQRFATSQPLSRREMEIEQALFQGQDRLGFLTALYHRGLDVLHVDHQSPRWAGSQSSAAIKRVSLQTADFTPKEKKKPNGSFVLHRWKRAAGGATF